MIGQRFGRLEVIERAENINGRVYWKCKCDCGNYHITRSSSLLCGACQSCGCLRDEINNSKKSIQANNYDLSGEYGIGYTLSGKQFFFDKEDYDLIKDYCWYINDRGYVATNIPCDKGQWKITMHRLIMDVLDNSDMVVDHIYHNKYDNRKSQLRIVNNQQNAFNHSKLLNNTSGNNGVYWHKKHQKWEALIGYNNKIIYLGLFENKEDAIKVRREAEEKYYGEYAYKEQTITDT